MKERAATVHVALSVPVLRAGMEPSYLTLVVLIGLLCLVLGTKASLWVAVCLLPVLWVIGRAMAKEDPQMIEVFFRHLRREGASDGGYVPAQSEPGASESSFEPMVKKALVGRLG